MGLVVNQYEADNYIIINNNLIFSHMLFALVICSIPIQHFWSSMNIILWLDMHDNIAFKMVEFLSIITTITIMKLEESKQLGRPFFEDDMSKDISKNPRSPSIEFPLFTLFGIF